MLPVLGACAEAAVVLPKRDFTTGWAAGCVVVMEPVEAVPVGALVMPGKMEGATVVLLVDPNSEGVLLKEAVEAGLVVVRGEGCPKPDPAVVAPKMGLKLWTEGLLSGIDVAEEEVVVTAKMGLNPEVSRGLVLLTGPELLAGAVAVTRLEAEEAVGVLIWLASPNRLAPATGGVPLEALVT